ncbi:hypothetical protein Tco_0355078, partial [Tanacetum coccineum]
MQTKIHVGNESVICVIKKPVYHSKTKHIEIRHHFIRDSYEKRLVEMVKIHIDLNVADLLTKSFDLGKRGRDTKIPQSGSPPIKVGDKAVHKELGDRMERATTTASSLKVEQDSVYDGNACWTNIGLYTARHKLNTASIKLVLPCISLYCWVKLIRLVFSNMKRVSRGSSGIDFSLFPFMISAPETSPSRITSSPSLSPQHTPVSTPSTSQPPNTLPTPDAEEAVPIPHELPLYSVHSLGHDKGSLSLSELTVQCTNLSNKITSLEVELAQSKQTYGTALTKLIKKGRSLIKELDMDAGISLLPPHAADEGRNDDTQIYDQPAEQLGVFSVATALADAATRRRSVETAQTYTRRRSVSTGSGTVSTASRTVSTAGVKAKDKRKAIMQESKPPKKLDEREEVAAEPTQAQKIDWSDPAVLRYHAQLNRPYSVADVKKKMVMYLKNQGGYKMNYFKGMKYEDIRPIFETVWDQIQSFVPIDSEVKEKHSKKKTRGSRKKTLARKRASGKDSEESIKKQKLEDDTEKEDLKAYLDIIQGDDVAILNI